MLFALSWKCFGTSQNISLAETYTVPRPSNLTGCRPWAETVSTLIIFFGILELGVCCTIFPHSLDVFIGRWHLAFWCSLHLSSIKPLA